MAHPRTLQGLTLLLPLLLLPWVPTTAGAGKLVLLSPREVNGSVGSTVILPCHLKPPDSGTLRVTLIRWTLLDPLSEPSILAEFHADQGSSIQDPNRMEFQAGKLGANLMDASLTIHRLTPEDDANYTCEIHTSPFKVGSSNIWLRVFYAPDVSLNLYEEIGKRGQKETSLYCVALSNPEPKIYDWSTTTGPLPSYAIPQGPHLLIHPTEESVDTTFVCRVSNDMGTDQAVLRVQLPGSPREQSHSPSAFRIGLWVSGIVLVSGLGALVYFLFRTQSPLDLHSARATGPVSRAAAKREDLAFQNPPTEGARGQMD